MTRRHFGAGLLALGAAGLTACMGPGLVHQPWVAYRPPLWRVERHGRLAAWLFGSLHIGREAFLPWPDPVEAAWRQSGPLAMEIDVAGRWAALVEGFRPRVELPEGLSLEDLLPGPTLDAARAFFGWSPQRWSTLRRRQPWWIINFAMATADDGMQDASRRWGVETELSDRRVREGRPLIELETVDETVAALAGGPLAEQAQQFERWFDLARWRGRLVHDMVGAWQSGDLTVLETLKDRHWGEPGGPDHPLGGLRERFFTVRDARMATRLLAAIDARMGAPDIGPAGLPSRAGGPIFVAVGAFHVVGPDSLRTRLEAEGCRVIDATPA